MAVAVNQPRKIKESQDPLDTIMKGLSVASTVYGIKDASEKRDLLAKQNALNEERLSAQADRDSQRLDLERQQVAQNQQKLNQDFSLKDRALKQEIAEKSSGKMLPASEAVSLGGANAAFTALEDAKKTFKANESISGPYQGKLSKAAGFLEMGDTGKQFKTYDAQLKANAQIIGKYLEGGKLTDSDIERYKDILPNHNDSPDIAEKKAVVLQNLIAQKQNAEGAALQQAGYNTGNLQLSRMQDNPNLKPQASGGITPEEARLELIRRRGIGSSITSKPGRN